ncbi:MAG: CopG family transcriptional regulator [Candidatus Muproteobacteria bacterium RBG_16_65_34]|uniref:CopG family transcriptional regulator n=1 Tax=Candidatus Muproteobacteria bacterium RBG_16_65_34 TaxID=1817760 RepID=A0A1F6TKB6_9PROT|nr:MAG: CopG family transcriptional regulator [Candidatus Muproteobacteria bacterium RBG_16_65_34]
MRIAKSLLLLLALAFSGLSFAAETKSATVYKSPTCGCCKDYVAYLEKNGFKVSAVNEENMDPVKARYGVSRGMSSCHTAIVGDYVVEGHVPVTAIGKLLANKPKIHGIALPGMPQNSPGMGEMKSGTLTVYELTVAGTPKVFSVE